MTFRFCHLYCCIKKDTLHRYHLPDQYLQGNMQLDRSCAMCLQCRVYHLSHGLETELLRKISLPHYNFRGCTQEVRGCEEKGLCDFLNRIDETAQDFLHIFFALNYIQGLAGHFQCYSENMKYLFIFRFTTDFKTLFIILQRLFKITSIKCNCPQTVFTVKYIRPVSCRLEYTQTFFKIFYRFIIFSKKQ